MFVWNVHEEAQEEDILDAFGEYGDVRNIHVNLDRRTGFVKGYVLIEYAERKEADAAIKAMNGADAARQTLGCDFASARHLGRAASSGAGPVKSARAGSF